MKNLGAKLALLQKRSGLPQAQSPPTLAVSNHDRLLTVLEASLRETRFGALPVVQKRYPLQQRYGRSTLGCSLRLPLWPLRCLYKGLEDFEMNRTLFFDTETTGLAGGSGTYAFLVGVAFFQDHELITEQYLMRDYSDEPALLEALAQRLEETDSLISFNGRTFDAQLLTTRYQMHRRTDPFGGRSHFDLLHICRRLWGLSPLPDCRLETLECKVLGAPRHQDVPGWLIPSLFFDFMRDRNPVPLKGVLEHNRRDLLAMVGLCGHLGHLLEQAEVEEPHLALGLARLWSAVGEVERGDRLYDSALRNRELDKAAREKGLLQWARTLKKRDQGMRAALLWRRVLIEFPANLEATIELAKWLEHEKRDYRSALILVEGGLRDRSLPRSRRHELEHRANRLRKRLG